MLTGANPDVPALNLRDLNLRDDFRDPALAEQLIARIRKAVQPDRTYRFMEFCGGHTHAFLRHGLTDRMPPNVALLHGPGCPVCVLPAVRIDQAIRLAEQEGVVLCSYGDMLRVPGSHQDSLQRARARGARIEIVYSPLEALALARREPQARVIFFAVGFETTTPPTAAVLQAAREANVSNFFVFCNHVLTLPAMAGILETPPDEQANPKSPQLDGIIGPGHVSVIQGSRCYEALVQQHRVGVVVSGFEPLDLLQSILLLIEQVNAGQPRVENQYRRAVAPDGNRLAQAATAAVFDIREDFEWRGLGRLPHSALQLSAAYHAFDAEQAFAANLEVHAPIRENRACACPQVLRGEMRPEECVLYGNPCTPDNPLGACMVSSEGACAAHYRYRGIPA